MSPDFVETHDIPLNVQDLSWFRQFVQLGALLDELAERDSTSHKILLVVPTNDFVQIALALGMSKSAFLSGVSETRPIMREQLAELKQGTKLLIRHPAGSRVVEFASVSEDFRRLSSLNSKGLIDISRATTFEIVSSDTPNGEYIDKEFDGSPQVERGARALWDSQQRPTLTMFGSRVQIEESLNESIVDSDLSKVAGIESSTLWDACRLDWLFNDSRAHSVNAFSMAESFPEEGTPELAFLEKSRWVILDGNRAISRTISREPLRKKNVLAILNLSGPREQNQAVQEFMAESNYWEPVALELAKGLIPKSCFLASWVAKDV